MAALSATAAAALRGRLEPIVRRAGDHLLASFEQLADDDVHHKGTVDLVTRLDVEAQAIVLAGLGAEFPGEAIIAEEDATAARILPEVAWLVDPLDGTTNFVHGQPPFAVSVARVRHGEIEVGMVYAPYLREMFFAAAGCGAFLGGRRLAVSRRDVLDDALYASGFAYDVRTNPHNNLREWGHFAVRCRGLRRGGAASLDLAYVAAGRLDGYWEFRLKPWDLGAGALLVLEAGGSVTDPAGGSSWLVMGDLVATNGLLHARTLAELRAARAPDGTRQTSQG
jgi:myo-inositol-1(or 4)-monophosphatase